MRFRRALNRGNVTEALSAASELQFVGLAEALELTLLLADGEREKYERAALRWHVRFGYETKNVDISESQAVLALLTAVPAPLSFLVRIDGGGFDRFGSLPLPGMRHVRPSSA